MPGPDRQTHAVERIDAVVAGRNAVVFDQRSTRFDLVLSGERGSLIVADPGRAETSFGRVSSWPARSANRCVNRHAPFERGSAAEGLVIAGRRAKICDSSHQNRRPEVGLAIHVNEEGALAMPRVCEFTGRRTTSGRTYTHRGKAKYLGGVGTKITGKTKRRFRPNLHTVTAVIDGTPKRVKASCKAIRDGMVVKPLKRRYAYKAQAEPAAEQ